MPDLIFPIVVSAAAGVALGVFFFGGLWLTVRQLAVVRHPVAWTVGSLWIRMAVVLAGFFWVMDGRWENAVGCLAGFIAGRFLVSGFLPCT